MAIHIHIQGRFNNHTTCSLYRILAMATSVMGVTKVGIIVPRSGLKRTSLAFRASVLPLHHLGFPYVTAINVSMQLFTSEVSADYYISIPPVYISIYIYSKIVIFYELSSVCLQQLYPVLLQQLIQLQKQVKLS